MLSQGGAVSSPGDGGWGGGRGEQGLAGSELHSLVVGQGLEWGEGGWLKWKTLKWQIFISFVNSFRKRWEHLAGTLQLS